MSESRPAVRQLPDRPNLDQLKKQAKELQVSRGLSLSAAQLALARDYGHSSWTRLKLAVEMATLRQLIHADDAAGVRQLVMKSPVLVRTTFEDGRLPLHIAAEENKPAVVDVLVTAGSPLGRTFADSSHTALSWAITCWSFDAARKLVELGDVPDLFCASGLGLLDAVKDFWPNGVLKHHPSKTGSSRYSDTGERIRGVPAADRDQVSDALYIACRSDRLDVAGWLLGHGADPNWRGYLGATCLAWAEFSGNETLCALLREHGGSDELLDQEYAATPKVFGLMVLADWGFARLLLPRLSADRSLANLSGGRGSLLHAAAASGQEACVRILLAHGADRQALNPGGQTPAEVARANGHHGIADLIAGQ